MSGTEAPYTRWVHLRIIDEPDESPTDQYRGDFWGLYLAVENIDGDFLNEHDLPKGNIYKMEFGHGKTAFDGNRYVRDQSDLRQFHTQLNRGRPPLKWWQSTVDLNRYYSYRSIVECIHDYDIGHGKNYFYYHNPASGKWIVLPWDIDLTWADRMYGNGYEPFIRSGVLNQNEFKRGWLRFEIFSIIQNRPDGSSTSSPQ